MAGAVPKTLDESNLVLLLNLIRARASLSALVQRGLRYSQIAALMSRAQELGLTTVDDSSGDVSLTELGIARLRTDMTTGRKLPHGGFISPKDEARLDKLAMEEVYLPPRRKSFFGLGRLSSPSAR